MGKWSYYAVRKGRSPGVFDNWEDAESQIKGYAKAKFKGFNDLEEAEAYVRKVDTPRKKNPGSTSGSALVSPLRPTSQASREFSTSGLGKRQRNLSAELDCITYKAQYTNLKKKLAELIESNKKKLPPHSNEFPRLAPRIPGEILTINLIDGPNLYPLASNLDLECENFRDYFGDQSDDGAEKEIDTYGSVAVWYLGCPTILRCIWCNQPRCVVGPLLGNWELCAPCIDAYVTQSFQNKLPRLAWLRFAFSLQIRSVQSIRHPFELRRLGDSTIRHSVNLA